jgi:hypothetical protein
MKSGKYTSYALDWCSFCSWGKTCTLEFMWENSHRGIQYIFFSTGFYSPYRTLAFLNGLLDPQTFCRTPWLGDQSNSRPLPKPRTTQHRNTQTHIHAPSRIRTCDLDVQALVDSTCLRPLGYWDRHPVHCVLLSNLCPQRRITSPWGL